MSYDPSEVPPPKARKARGRTGTSRLELEDWFKELDPGGFRYAVHRIHPTEEFIGRQQTKVKRELLEEAGPGIYEIQCETKNNRGEWISYQAPKRIEITGSEGAKTNDSEQRLQAYMMDRLRLADRQVFHQPQQNSRQLEDLERTYRDRTEDLKRDHADKVEQHRMMWTDRLEMSRSAHRAEVQLWESRVRELEERSRRIEDELREARSKQKDSLSTTLETLSAFEQLQPFIGKGQDSSPWTAVFGEVLKNKDALGEMIGGVFPKSAGGSPGTVPQVAAQAPAPLPAAPRPEIQNFAGILGRLFGAEVSPVDSYQQLAPTLPAEALSAIGEASSEDFVGEVLRSAPASSSLITAKGTEWLNELHQLVKKLHGSHDEPKESADEQHPGHDPSDGKVSEA